MSNANRKPPSLTEIEQALYAIPPDIERERWYRILAVSKSELGEDGRSIADSWSKGADSYKPSDFNSTWNSLNGNAGIGIATLFHHARQYGGNPPPRKPSMATPERDTSNTRAYALELWLNARSRRQDPDITSYPYAIRKGIESAGGAGRAKASGRIIGKEADCIIVPIRDIQTDKVQGVQCINTEGGKQTFGSVSGGGLLLGNTLNKSLPWYVCEGWASAYSVVFHHCHGNGVCAVAFGKSNIDKLAQRIDAIHNPAETVILREQD